MLLHALVHSADIQDRDGGVLVMATLFGLPDQAGISQRVFEAVGTPEEIDSFEELVRPHGVKEMVRTGRVGLARTSTARTPNRQHALS